MRGFEAAVLAVFAMSAEAVNIQTQWGNMDSFKFDTMELPQFSAGGLSVFDLGLDELKGLSSGSISFGKRSNLSDIMNTKKESEDEDEEEDEEEEEEAAEDHGYHGDLDFSSLNDGLNFSLSGGSGLKGASVKIGDIGASKMQSMSSDPISLVSLKDGIQFT